MSLTPDHIAKSLKNAERNYPGLFYSRKEELEALIIDIHEWFDLFSMHPFAELYGYTGLNAMMHREQRHHNTGLWAAKYVHLGKYGEEFRQVIECEIATHFNDDFFMLDDINKIPDIDDYSNPRFMRKTKGF